LRFFPDADVLQNAEPVVAVRGDAAVRLSLPATRRQPPPPVPARLSGVLVVSQGDARRAFAVDAPLSGAAEPAWTVAGGGDDGPSSLWTALLLALAGGVLLNLMPCVLPVLSLKVLGFVQQAGEAPALVRRHGWVYGLGVLASFWALAGILLALRAGGEAVAWGFQLQDPAFVAVTALVMVALSLNLFGVFEVGTSLSRLASAGPTTGYAGSFAGGVLATVVATPCSAPFMGTAVGYGLTRPAVEAVAVLTALGVGMAAPYVLLSAFPRWLARVPRPGPWMESMKRLLAFPLLATALWLAWVTGRVGGPDAMAWLLVGALGTALGLFVYGRWGNATRRPAVRWGVGRGVGLAAVAVSVALVLRGPPAAASPLAWEPWGRDRVELALASGRPVLVDFTADWCLTCKANEGTTLASSAVLDAVRRTDAVTLKADWTRRDAAIGEALAGFGRSSVPLYVVYSPVPGRRPAVLPVVPTPSGVAEALDAALAQVPSP
jgi:thiol:disulfide interchange protein DsbD